MSLAQAQGEIFDLGYQHYGGPRVGRGRIVLSLWVNGVRTTLGLGRGARAKILPLLMFLFVTAPAAGIVLISSIAGPEAEILPSHEDYYAIVSIFLVLFSAVMAPELLIPDRRSGVISLYLVRPLTSVDYVAARWSAFLSIALILVYSGQVFLLVGFLLTSGAPVDYLRDNWLDIPRFLAAGVVVALFVTTIPMAVTAFTTRRAYAASLVIAVFVVTIPMTEALTATSCEVIRTERQHEDLGLVVEEQRRCERVTGDDLAKWFVMLDVGRAPIHLSYMIFDTVPEGDNVSRLLQTGLHSAIPVAWYAILVIAPGALLLLRYRRITI